METPITQPETLLPEIKDCKTCKHWKRRMIPVDSFTARGREELGLPPATPKPTLYGLCKSREVGRSSYVKVSYPNSEIYDDCENEIDMDDLETDLYTRQDFGCIHYAKM